MKQTSLPIGERLADIYGRRVDMVYNVCYAYMKNAADAEDMVQSTFLALMTWRGELKSPEHEKAWLLRTAINLCKNRLAHWWRRRTDIADCRVLPGIESFGISETLRAVMDLPDRYKAPVLLYYYEGYTGAETARILKRPQSTIRNHLREARKILKGVLGNE